MEAARTQQRSAAQVRKSLLTWGVVILLLVLIFTVGFDTVWREGIIRPMLNALMFLYTYLGRNFFVAIAVLTIILRLITLPLAISSTRSQRKIAAVQPIMQELQKKYASDKERLLQEQQKLYKELGTNQLSGCLPTLVQFPIWIGLYQSITSILADTPLELMRLGVNLYADVAAFSSVIPLQSKFLWFNLAQPDRTMVLPILVATTMYLQQRLAMRSSPVTDPQQQAMNNMMQLMMPLMFAYFTMQFASGMALYFVISNVVGIVMQWGIDRMVGPVTEADLPASILASSKDKASHARKRQRRRSKR